MTEHDKSKVYYIAYGCLDYMLTKVSSVDTMLPKCVNKAVI